MRNPPTTGFGGTPALWQRFMPRRHEVESRIGTDLISMRIFHREADEPLTPSTPFEEWAAVEVAEGAAAPAGMETRVVPAGEYAVFVHRGVATEIPATARYIHTEWLPASPYEVDDRPHLAVMPASYRPDDPEAEEELWIPVRRVDA